MWNGSSAPSRVTRDGFERDVHAVAEAVAVVRREIAIDAVADLIAFGVHADRFADLHAGVGGDGDVAVEVEDAFGGECAAREWQRDEDRAPTPKRKAHAFPFSRLREKVPEADEGSFASVDSKIALTPALSRKRERGNAEAVIARGAIHAGAS